MTFNSDNDAQLDVLLFTSVRNRSNGSIDVQIEAFLFKSEDDDQVTFKSSSNAQNRNNEAVDPK